MRRLQDQQKAASRMSEFYLAIVFCRSRTSHWFCVCFCFSVLSGFIATEVIHVAHVIDIFMHWFFMFMSPEFYSLASNLREP